MKFSVIIPFYNAASTLDPCLQSITQQLHSDFEVILVDNNSNDHSPLIASCFVQSPHPFPVKLINEPTPGAGHARNAGIAAAQGEWIAFTDADCIISPTWLEEYERKIMQLYPSVGAVAGSIQSAPPTNTIQACAGLFTLPPISEEATFSNLINGRGGFPTANLAVRKSVLTEIGGFNLGNTCGEDYQLCSDIYAAGYRIHAFPQAIVHHIHRDKLKPLLKQAVNIGQSHAYCQRELFERATIIEWPRGTMNLPHLGRIWIDLNQADKKMGMLLLPMLFWWPLVLIPLLYFSHLCHFCLNKSISRNTRLAPGHIPLIALILIAKSGAVSWGRLQGSRRYKVICF